MRTTKKAILTDAATDFWATDMRKVWDKSRMRATYIPDMQATPLTFRNAL